MSWSFSNIPFLPSFFFIQLSIERTVSYTISISVTIRSFFFYNQLYVKIMHICKSVLKYYNLIFYNRLLSASLSPSRKQVLFHTVLLIAINRFFFLFFPFMSTMWDDAPEKERKENRRMRFNALRENGNDFKPLRVKYLQVSHTIRL